MIFKLFRLEKTSVRRATLKAYKELPKEFTAPQLVSRVRKRLKRKPMEDTVMRMLRDLRQDEQINYQSIDRAKSRYQKVA